MEQDPESKYLSPDEFRQQLDKLSAIDVAKIMAVSKAKHVSGTGMEAEDLLVESIARALHGSRKVPRGIPIVAFLIEVIRSIASTERKKTSKIGVGHEIAFISLEDRADELAELSGPTLAPDQIIEEAEHAQYCERVIDELNTSLIGDPNAQAILSGRMKGLTPSEIKERSKMSPHVYDAARKKVDRAFLRINSKRN